MMVNDIIRWLLDGDRAVRWQTFCDLLGAREPPFEQGSVMAFSGHLDTESETSLSSFSYVPLVRALPDTQRLVRGRSSAVGPLELMKAMRLNSSFCCKAGACRPSYTKETKGTKKNLVLRTERSERSSSRV